MGWSDEVGNGSLSGHVSAVTTMMRRASDVDIGVLSTHPLPTGALSLVREALEDSTVPQVVGLVDLGQTDNSFRDAVIRDGEKWTA